MMLALKRILIGMMLFFPWMPVLACTGGQDWVGQSGLYTTDVTDDTPFIDPGQIVHFDFALQNKSDPAYGPDELIAYSVVRVTLMHGREQVFTKDLPFKEDREFAG